MAAVLEGIRILDWTQWQMGPVATALLADLGAEVIHIEDPKRGDPGRGMKRMRNIPASLPGGRSAYFEYNNRGKKGMAIDLKRTEGKEVLYRLVRNSDVFVHNFRQGVPEKMGLDYETLSKHNPKLIYASLSGYGQKGPEAQDPAFDYLGLARSGMMTAAGEPDAPPSGFVGGISDQMGAIMAGYGILAALFVRERLGIGQKIDVSLLGSMMTLQGAAIAARFLLGQPLPRENRHKAANPLWNHYCCADGKWIVLGMLQSDRQWPLICRALGIEHLEKEPKFENADKRSENCEELVSVMDRIFATKSSTEWIKILKGAGDIICTPVQSVSDIANDPQAWANGYLVELNHRALGRIVTMGFPVQFSKTPVSITPEAPEFGQHTEDALIEVGGYTWEEIAILKEKGVI